MTVTLEEREKIRKLVQLARTPGHSNTLYRKQETELYRYCSRSTGRIQQTKYCGSYGQYERKGKMSMTVEELYTKMDEYARLHHDRELAVEAFNAARADLDKRKNDLMDEIRDEVLGMKQTVKTDLLTVQYKKGKVSWNGKLLEGFALAHPNILEARSEGKPSVAFVVAHEGWKDDGR